MLCACLYQNNHEMNAQVRLPAFPSMPFNKPKRTSVRILLVIHVGGDRNRDNSKSFPH